MVLGEKLGKGATATVWSGTYDGKPVAVKQITLRAFKGIFSFGAMRLHWYRGRDARTSSCEARIRYGKEHRSSKRG